VSGALSTARLDNLISIGHESKKFIYPPPVIEYIRNYALGKSLANHKMGIREFTEIVLDRLSSIENDWKLLSDSINPDVLIQDPNESLFKVV
jgi:hypothetical protein